MGQGELPLEETARSRSRIAVLAAGLIAVFAAAEVAQGVPNVGALLAARAAWVGALLVAARLLLRARGRATTALVAATVSVSVGALLVISLVQPGDVGSIAFLIAAPLLVAVLVPDAVGTVAAAAVLSTAAVAFLFATREGGLSAVTYGFRAAAAGAVAVLGATNLARVRRDELRIVEERARTAAALVRSERRRAEVEPLAVAGSRAARAAHDMSNPLASIRANLDWLRDAAEENRLQTEEAEVLEVIVEARACVELLGTNLADFRAAARAADPIHAHAPGADERA
jgi:signal transduction histidine kinase